MERVHNTLPFTCLIFPLSTFPSVFNFDYSHNCPLLRGWGDQLCAKHVYLLSDPVQRAGMIALLCIFPFTSWHHWVLRTTLLMCFGDFLMVKLCILPCVRFLCCHLNWTARYIHKPFILSSWLKDNMREGLCCGTWLTAMMRLLHQLSCLGGQILTVGENWTGQEWLVFCHLIITNPSLPYWGCMWGP